MDCKGLHPILAADLRTPFRVTTLSVAVISLHYMYMQAQTCTCALSTKDRDPVFYTPGVGPCSWLELGPDTDSNLRAS